MLRHIYCASLAIGLLCSSVPASEAQETGLHKLHPIKRSGAKLCMTEHEHAGESLPSGSEKVALKLAINKWAEFTTWEYGKSWGDWGLAVGKKQNCTGSGSNWVCAIVARPCRKG